MFQLIWLYFNNVKKDQKMFDNLMNGLELQLKNRALDPQQAFSDSLTATLYNHNKWMKPMELKDLKKVNLDRILQIAKERFTYVDGYTFTIIGNFEENEIRPLIARYLGSLPVKGEIKKGHKLADIVKGNVKNNFKRKMETPTALAVMIWTNKDMEHNLQNSVRASIAGQVLSMIYLKKIREDAGAAYSVGASGQFQRGEDEKLAMIQAQCPMKPEMADVALKIMDEEVNNLTKSCDADMLTKVKEYMLRSHEESLKQNGYWQNEMVNYVLYGEDNDAIYVDTVNSITAADIQEMARQIFKSGNLIEVGMTSPIEDSVTPNEE